ncbi:MFS transporter [Neisseria sp. Ec49-e6-T10]|uniref:MFS transporter n=1 Tax=Neisseria sp. Ec49-e6-T10 TaxID=3140744 RepID=UPI003EBE53E3
MSINNRYGTALSIYINYIVQGVCLIIIIQNIDVLATALNTDAQGIGFVASGYGLGKFLVIFISGILSDKFGRKPFVLLGVFSYIVFLLGILASPNIAIAFAFAVIGGMGNSFLDTGSSPALMECFPKTPGTANVLIKAFISSGNFILPFMVNYFLNNGYWYGWTFIIFTILLAINAFFICLQKYPATLSLGADKHVQEQLAPYLIGKPKMHLEGICLILMGFTTTATFLIIAQWIPKIAMQTIGMDPTAARELVSLYSVGSLLSVFVTAFLVQKLVKPVTFLIVYPMISSILLCAFLLFQTDLMCKILAFGMGFSAAGGVLQLAFITMAQLFPKRKGSVLGIVYTMVALAVFIVPIIVPTLAKININYVVAFNLSTALACVVLALIINIRFRKTVNMRLL